MSFILFIPIGALRCEWCVWHQRRCRGSGRMSEGCVNTCAPSITLRLTLSRSAARKQRRIMCTSGRICCRCVSKFLSARRTFYEFAWVISLVCFSANVSCVCECVCALLVCVFCVRVRVLCMCVCITCARSFFLENFEWRYCFFLCACMRAYARGYIVCVCVCTYLCFGDLLLFLHSHGPEGRTRRAAIHQQRPPRYDSEFHVCII